MTNVGEGVNGAAGFGLQGSLCFSLGPIDTNDANPPTSLHPPPLSCTYPEWSLFGVPRFVCALSWQTLTWNLEMRDILIQRRPLLGCRRWSLKGRAGNWAELTQEWGS